MKRLTFAGLLIALSIGLVNAQTWVNGYTKSDGTYVQGHYRSNPNSTVRDNYNYKGNTNPYTGEQGSNYYRSNPSSEYYNGSQQRNRNNTYNRQYQYSR